MPSVYDLPCLYLCTSCIEWLRNIQSYHDKGVRISAPGLSRRIHLLYRDEHHRIGLFHIYPYLTYFPINVVMNRYSYILVRMYIVSHTYLPTYIPTHLPRSTPSGVLMQHLRPPRQRFLSSFLPFCPCPLRSLGSKIHWIRRQGQGWLTCTVVSWDEREDGANHPSGNKSPVGRVPRRPR